MAEQRTVYERIQAAAKAALGAWRGDAVPRIQQQLYWDGLTSTQRKRVERYNLLWKYYEGEHKKPLITRTNMPDDNVIINHSRTVVDRGLAFLFGKTLDWQLQEGEQTEPEQALDNAWGGIEQRMSFLHDVGLNGAVCGTFYIQLVPRKSGLPRLINLNPAIVFPFWNPHDVDDVWAYELRFRGGGDKVERTVYSLETDEAGNRIPDRWVFWSERLERTGTWAVIREKQMWPWEWSPILVGKNLPRPNDFYGYSDLEDADLNDVVNFIAGNTNRLLRLYAHPVLYGHGLGRQDLDISPGEAIIASNPNAFLKYLEMASQLGSSHEYFRMLQDNFFRVMRVPDMDPQTMRLGAQSGFALRVLHSPLLEKTEVKRRQYGMAIIELNRRLLDMMGHGDDNRVALQWQDPLPVDERTRTESHRFDHDAELVSRQTLAEQRGYIWAREEELIEEETAAREALEKANAIQALTNAGGSLHGSAEVAGLTELQIERLLEIDIGVNGSGVEQ